MTTDLEELTKLDARIPGAESRGDVSFFEGLLALTRNNAEAFAAFLRVSGGFTVGF